MYCVETARAGGVEGNTWPSEIVEPAEAVGEHGGASSRCLILVLESRITGEQCLILLCKAPHKDPRLRAAGLL